MVKNNTKVFVLKVPVWEAEVVVCIGSPTVGFRKVLLRTVGKPRTEAFLNGIEDLLGRADSPHNTGPSVLYVRDFPVDPEGMNTLVHEVTHVTDGIMARKGVPNCDETREAYCYMNGWLTEQILKRVTIGQLKRK